MPLRGVPRIRLRCARLPETPPDHSTDFAHASLDRSRDTRGRFHLDAAATRRRGLVKGKTVGIDATTLEVNAALRSIVRRDTVDDEVANPCTLTVCPAWSTSSRGASIGITTTKQSGVGRPGFAIPNDIVVRTSATLLLREPRYNANAYASYRAQTVAPASLGRPAGALAIHESLFKLGPSRTERLQERTQQSSRSGFPRSVSLRSQQ